MDIKLKATTLDETGLPVLDFECKNGNVLFVEPSLEKLQRATVAAFLIKGTIPTLPALGVPWNDFLTSKIDFGDLDFKIQEHIQAAGCSGYVSSYALVNQKLKVTVTKGEAIQ